MEKIYGMSVVGITTQQHVYVASQERKFRMNEILVLEDIALGNPKAEVVETFSFNKFIPVASEKNGMADSNALKALEGIGYSVDDGEINLAKVRLIVECPFPVTTGTNVRLPEFSEVKDLLVKRKPSEGLVLGVLKGTEEIANTMPEELNNIALLFDQETKQVLPQGAVPFIFDFKQMDQYPHIGIFGGSGSGKSFGTRVVIEEILKKRVPGIVFDPHFEMTFDTEFPNLPKEYRQTFSERFVILTAGKDLGIKFNDLSQNELISILNSAAELTDAMESAIKLLHDKKDTYTDFETRLDDLIKVMEDYNAINKAVNNNDIDDEKELEIARRRLSLHARYATKISSANTLVGIQWRLGRLKGEGVFVSDTSKVSENLLQRKTVVIQGSLKALQYMAGYIIGKMYHARRHYRDAIQKGEKNAEQFPPFVIVADEAHNFAPKGDIKAPAKDKIKEIAQEGRKYGVFLILATQRPNLLDETTTAQLNTKFVFRTTRSSDIQLIREETDISPEDSNRLPYLQSGDCFVSSAITGRTLFIRVRVAKTMSPHSENPFDELEEMFVSSNNDLFLAISEFCPMNPMQRIKVVQEINKKYNKVISIQEFDDILNNLVIEGKLIAEKTPIGDLIDVNPN